MNGSASLEDQLVEARDQDGVLIVRVLHKRLTASTAPLFKTIVTRQVEAGQHHVVLDLAEVDFMDSSALGAVVSCMKSVGSRGTLAISGAHGAVLKLLKLTRLDRVLKLHDTPEQAASAIRQS
ncbi:STAS domain-containing protein [Geminicoccus roseus]|uniref:STAS domain-containing protein n=1 Tax=Geminicoccus roseus TaxID=404900 RepID=UPI0003FAC109|nr:STAS domain-containing protein [Geminicoccus roseus]